MEKLFFEESLKKINLKLNQEQVKKFDKFQEILLEWNEKINLTAITEEKEIITKHFIDSLSIEKYIREEDSVIDIGSGAGFPGIPIKILGKGSQVLLLDSLNKRVIYLKEVIEKLELKNIDAVHARAEEFARNASYREKFDIATARAVAKLAILSEYCLPYVKVGGFFIAMKGSNIDEELSEAKEKIKLLGGKISKIENIKLPFSDMQRNLVIIEKVKKTEKIYPRRKVI